MIRNYPFYGIVEGLKTVLMFWITSEMIYNVMRDPLTLSEVESGSEIARFNEMMSLTPEAF